MFVMGGIFFNTVNNSWSLDELFLVSHLVKQGFVVISVDKEELDTEEETLSTLPIYNLKLEQKIKFLLLFIWAN